MSGAFLILICLVSKTLLALHVTMQSSESEGDKTRPKTLNATVNETANSEQTKLLFVAGVEGAGHHFFTSLWKTALEKSEGVQGECCGGPCGEAWPEGHMEKLAQKFKALEPGFWTLPQTNSYPCMGMGDHEGRRDLFHPRLDWIVEAASKERVNLHVLLIYRDLETCLEADCMNRRFEECKPMSETLASNAQILAGHLEKALAKPGWVTTSCLKYGDLGSMAAAAEQVMGQSPGVYQDEVERAWNPDRHNATDEAQKHQMYPKWDEYKQAMASSNATLARLCESMGTFNTTVLARWLGVKSLAQLNNK